MKKLTLIIASLLLVLSSLMGQDILGGLFGAAKNLDPKVIKSAEKVGQAFQKSAEDITPEQEYYIGRSVTANVLQKYPAFDREKANRYLNLVLQNLAQYSLRPETFGGYHALLLDSDQINAFGAPGGFILVTRGMLHCCSNETELAAVLAHEIAHVQYQHGLKAIKNDRLTSAFAVLGTEVASNYGSEDLQKLTTAFGGSITDITKTLINNGYSRDLEVQADQGAVDILKAAGYNPEGLVSMLQAMKKQLKPGGLDFAKTHPSPDARIRTVNAKIGKTQAVQEAPAMTARFHDALDGI